VNIPSPFGYDESPNRFYLFSYGLLIPLSSGLLDRNEVTSAGLLSVFLLGAPNRPKPVPSITLVSSFSVFCCSICPL
jgi:hypothetical protein